VRKVRITTESVIAVEARRTGSGVSVAKSQPPHHVRGKSRGRSEAWRTVSRFACA